MPAAPDIGRCHVVEARRKAVEADIVIVNHHLLLADLALKEDGFGDLLGAADAVILDEAHQIPDLATQFFGTRLGSRQVELLLRDARQELGAVARAGHHAAASSSAPSRNRWLALAEILRATPRPDWLAADTPLADAAQDLSRSLRELSAALNEYSREPGDRAMRGARHGTRRAARRGRARRRERRRAQRRAHAARLHLEPVAVRHRGALRAMAGGTRAAWVFTSATLSVGEDFAHFTSRLGLADAETLAIAEPVRFRDAGAALSTGAAAGSVGAGAHRRRGRRGGAAHRSVGRRRVRAVHQPSRAAARGAAACAIAGPSSANFRCWCRARRRASSCCARFRESGNAVLLGTASFWEGVDVKGDALRLVIIEKLPFSSPDDALTKARIEHLKANGGNAFREYQLPEAALALKQGVGRLIRSETDRGVVVICDPRLVDKPYGRVFRASLPPMPVTRVAADAEKFLRRIAGTRARARGAHARARAR